MTANQIFTSAALRVSWHFIAVGLDSFSYASSHLPVAGLYLHRKQAGFPSASKYHY